MNLEDIIYGNGSDGSPTISTPIVLTRDMYYDTVSLAAGGSINVAGYRIFARTKLDLTAADPGAIFSNGANGNNASAGTAGSFLPLVTASYGAPYVSAAQGGSSGGTGVGAQAAAVGSTTISYGGIHSGDNGKGGNGAVNAGGAQRTTAVMNFDDGPPQFGLLGPLTGAASLAISTSSVTIPLAGIPSVPGSSGGGGGAGQTSGGGGGGALSGGGIYIFALEIDVTGAPAACIQARGGNGGNGGTVSAANAGGGGGAGGASGGLVQVTYETLTGSVADLIDVSGGNGGNGGNGGASASGGDGGGSGASGRLVTFDTANNAFTSAIVNTTRNAGGSAAGSTGGTGATAAVAQISL